MWLLYQVKHSHDKRKAFDEKNMEISNSVEEMHEILKFGRKDLNHGIEMASEMQKHGKEGESVEEEQESEEVEESKEEEGEDDEERGVGDDEIDEIDQDRADEEEHEEDSIDEEDENEETENIEKEEKEGKVDEENEVIDALEDQNHARTRMNSQEAHEKQYKGDDASSAVVPNTQTLRNIEIEGLEKSDEEQLDNAEKNDLKDDRTNGNENSNVRKNMTKITIVLGGDEKIDSPSINAGTNGGAEVSSSMSEDKPLNSTEESNNQTILYGNSPADNIKGPSSMLQNVSTGLDSTQDENATVKVTTSDHGNPSPQTTVLEQTEISNTTATADESANSAASSTTNENYGKVQTETTGSLVTQEQKNPLTHLGTLPETGQEEKNAKDVAA